MRSKKFPSACNNNNTSCGGGAGPTMQSQSSAFDARKYLMSEKILRGSVDSKKSPSPVFDHASQYTKSYTTRSNRQYSHKLDPLKCSDEIKSN